MKKILFIDALAVVQKKGARYNTFNTLFFQPGVFQYLGKIARQLNYNLALINLPAGNVPVQAFIANTFKNEGIVFKKVKPEDKSADAYEIYSSYIISGSKADAVLAKQTGFGFVAFGKVSNWESVYKFLAGDSRKVKHSRITKETAVEIELNPDGQGKAEISTGLNFFDHMLEQIARHGGLDLKIEVKGDLHIDEHHTIEDTAITLGEAVLLALGDKRGIERYGFCLPMDEALAQVAIDFGGRNDLVWNAEFKREKVGDVPTEMFYHFFKSFSDAAKSNVNIKVEGKNEHHKIEAIFKAFAKAIKMGFKRDLDNMQLPSTKGIL